MVLSPPNGLCPRAVFLGLERPYKLAEDAVLVALAGSLPAERSVEHGLDADLEDDTGHLHAHRIGGTGRAQRWGRPRQNLVKVIERHAKQPLDLLCRPERPPRGMGKPGS